LCEIIAQLHDANGRITIPEFYDRVRDWPESERARMARSGPSDRQILRDARVERPGGERGYSLYERTTIRPALTINGISGGYQGPGGKAVIPSLATAKISFRLVPDQDPRDVEQLVRRHLCRITPAAVQLHVRSVMRAQPALIDSRQAELQAASRAYRQAFGAVPQLIRSGGTIPVVNLFQQLLSLPTVLMGFALPDDRIHAPNEKFHLPVFHRGIATCIAFLTEVRRLAPVHESGSRDRRRRQGAAR
jgi:acetylornithine deacetylase/succinyl-diaminopimelate desuccinylase-like protein